MIKGLTLRTNNQSGRGRAVKALVSGTSHESGVGSNPTAHTIFFLAWLPLRLTSGACCPLFKPLALYVISIGCSLCRRRPEDPIPHRSQRKMELETETPMTYVFLGAGGAESSPLPRDCIPTALIRKTSNRLRNETCLVIDLGKLDACVYSELVRYIETLAQTGDADPQKLEDLADGWTFDTALGMLSFAHSLISPSFNVGESICAQPMDTEWFAHEPIAAGIFTRAARRVADVVGDERHSSEDIQQMLQLPPLNPEEAKVQEQTKGFVLGLCCPAPGSPLTSRQSTIGPVGTGAHPSSGIGIASSCDRDAATQDHAPKRPRLDTGHREQKAAATRPQAMDCDGSFA